MILWPHIGRARASTNWQGVRIDRKTVSIILERRGSPAATDERTG
jgi:hypothetical protein